jgi:hypothetical protein
MLQNDYNQVTETLQFCDWKDEKRWKQDLLRWIKRTLGDFLRFPAIYQWYDSYAQSGAFDKNMERAENRNGRCCREKKVNLKRGTYEMLDRVLFVMQIVLALVGGYQLFLSFFGWYRKKAKIQYAPQKTFAILVAAHNEEQVVGALIENLKSDVRYNGNL